jgi:hypothetical protein
MRAYAPVLASFKELPEGDIELWITNDGGRELRGEAQVSLATFAGESILKGTVAIAVPAQHSRPVKRWSAGELGASADRYLWVQSTENHFPANRYFFVPIKDLKRPAAQVRSRIRQQDDHHMQLDLQVDNFAYFVHLATSASGTHFDDNYFDLPAGGSRAISIRNQDSRLSPQMIAVDWR